ncbi:MAG: DNA polymerase Y family protein [Rhodomicrobiaceae bacterium]
MQRVISIWFPFWSTDRLERRSDGGVRLHDPAAQPLAVTEKGPGGKRLVRLNRAAREAGLHTGMLITDACAMLPTLKTAPLNRAAERRDLVRLAGICNRFTPWTAPDEPDGLWIEATGLAHLFGGEEALLPRILFYLHGLGFAARGAMAGTAGAAWGLARCHEASSVIVPSGEEVQALCSLPVKALRIDPDSTVLLNRLGLKTIGQLLAIPRASLRARLGNAITCRLDQALGANGEALSPLTPEPVYAARLEFTDPLTALAGLERTAEILIESVGEKLKGDGKGARRFSLTLFDTQNGKTEISLQMARASAEPKHISRVLKKKLGKLEDRFDPSLGFDAVALYALSAETLINRQTEILDGPADRDNHQEKFAQFLDRVSARLGDHAVTRFGFAESYWPERASFHRPASVSVRTSKALPAISPLPRPLMLLPRPEPIEVIALVPDYPPRKFTWRRRAHLLARGEGPERISPEWWEDKESAKTPQARDYYIVEDKQGQRFWIYREDVYRASEQQRWFMHGLFP